MQHIKLAITRTNSRSKPTASATINTTEPASAHTNARIDCDNVLLEHEHVTAYVTRSGNKVYCNIVTSFVRTNRGIPLNQCLFVLI